MLFGGDFNEDLLDSSNRGMDIISNLLMPTFTPIMNSITRESDTAGHVWIIFGATS